MNLPSSPTFKRPPKTGVIIPVFGETETIISVLGKLKRLPVSSVCVVIDVPLKSVMEKIRIAAKEAGVPVHIIKNESRRGVGYALRQGMEYLNNTDHSIAVTISGNGKDDPREVDRLLTPVVNGRVDYVQGSRYLKGGRTERMPFVRKVFNRFYPLLWTILTDRKCTDVTNGYRCYRLDMLKDRRINLRQEWLNGYSLEYYLHYKALTLDYRIIEVPVSKVYLFGHRGGYSRIQPLKDWWPILSPLVLLFLGVRK
ncbi:MAG: glycosyltransferase family 2 protein [Nitrososphaerota archaeon]|nr:glycosyltransferase family 2 protein [Nitrososphaerota archaeon]MDG7014913.1 glycosyltransferase family 2 protein [Nitrososphaerota archaeon]WGO50873.1 MAG: glycosyltransferase family 2 protein [Nitrososphaerota archaeon]